MLCGRGWLLSYLQTAPSPAHTHGTANCCQVSQLAYLESVVRVLCHQHIIFLFLGQLLLWFFSFLIVFCFFFALFIAKYWQQLPHCCWRHCCCRCCCSRQIITLLYYFFGVATSRRLLLLHCDNWRILWHLQLCWPLWPDLNLRGLHLGATFVSSICPSLALLPEYIASNFWTSSGHAR